MLHREIWRSTEKLWNQRYGKGGAKWNKGGTKGEQSWNKFNKDLTNVEHRHILTKFESICNICGIKEEQRKNKGRTKEEQRKNKGGTKEEKIINEWDQCIIT